MPRTYHVYILSSRKGTLYIGVTGTLAQRLGQHRDGSGSAFAHRYHTIDLVYTEEHVRPIDAIEREKQIKRWSRAKKVALIKRQNPMWLDLPLALA